MFPSPGTTVKISDDPYFFPHQKREKIGRKYVRRIKLTVPQNGFITKICPILGCGYTR